MHKPSTRAQIITRRTYSRPLNEEGTEFETWEETISRVIKHQQWLWERALTQKNWPDMPLNDITEDMYEWVKLNNDQLSELEQLRTLLLERKVAVAGRCFTGDTKVKLLDGTTPRFDELVVGKTYWAYGSTMEGKVVPVEAINNGVTRIDHSYAKITLDNDEVITCTVDHPFLLRDGRYLEAKDLEEGTSLMPLYTRFNRLGYEEVLDNSTGEWTTTHKLVAIDQQLPKPTITQDQFFVIHHKDFNKHNNTPENLDFMGDRDHFILHSKLGKENAKKLNDLIWHHPDYEGFRIAKAAQCREMALDFWNNDKYEDSRKAVAKKSSERAIVRNKTKQQKEALKVFRASEKGVNISISNLRKANKDHYGIKVKLFKQAKRLVTELNLELNEQNWDSNRPYAGAMKFSNIDKFFGSMELFLLELETFNHSIKSVEIIYSESPIKFYDFSVPRTVNFALASGVFVHNTLWLGGTEIARTIAMSQFNCAAINAQTVHDIVDIFWGLLNGSGMGFRPVAGTLTGFRKVIPKVTFIPSTRTADQKGCEDNEEWMENGVWYIKIGDSAKAWSKSIGKILAGKYNANELVIDFSEIRGGGKRLRNYGWLSQGSKGLMKSYAKVVDIMNKRADSLLSAMDILDIVNLLGTVLSTRRSAQIAIMDYSNAEWEVFATAKDAIFSIDGSETGLEHRTQSNNSILFDNKPPKNELSDLIYMMDRGGKGEPGLINGVALKERAPWATLMNPCMPEYVNLLTKGGIRQLKDINIGEEVYSEDGWVTVLNKWSTGIKPVYRYNTTTGSIDLTDNHRVKYLGSKIEVGRAEGIDTIVMNEALHNLELSTQDVIDGLTFGDGYYHKASNCFMLCIGDKDKEYYSSEISGYISEFRNYSATRKDGVAKVKTTLLQQEVDKTYEKTIPDRFYFADSLKIRGFLRGLYSANGSVLKSAKRITFKSASKSLILQVSKMLSSLGIHSYYTTNRAKNVLFSNGEYTCKESYDLNITSDRIKFKTLIGFIHKYKMDTLENICATPHKKAKVTYDITASEYVGEMEVFDITVSGPSHTFWCEGFNVSNCAEILLPSKGGTCNLVSIDLGKFHGNNSELLEAARIISRANYRQTCIDFRDGILQESWSLNSDHLRLCGVSLMGVVKRPDMGAYEYRTLRRHETSAAYSMAEELNLPYPKNISTIKPEGTQSKCYDSTEGMHMPLGKYIFNNVAFSIHDPLIKVLRKANYRVFPHPYDDTAMLVTLPIAYEDVKFDIVDGKEVNLESAVQQLDRYKMLMDNYCDQNVSCTISYDNTELPDIVDWLYANWDSYVAVSFLKRNDPTKTAKDLGYPYLPQEVVTKEEYSAYVSKLLDFDLDANNSHEELLEDGCSGGVCPVR